MLPAVIVAAGERACRRFLEFFTAQIRNPNTRRAYAQAVARFLEWCEGRGIALEGVWVQHMFAGNRELLVTAFRDQEFGVMVGCGIGGEMTEIVDDVIFARAPIDAEDARDLLMRLRTLRRLPDLLSVHQQERAALFIARFSALAATAPWQRFTFEVNPLKLGEHDVAAVDGLLIIE